jgi:EAL domain-containing protein (putative c-di-GMP-specific phosphodiesterase class I)
MYTAKQSGRDRYESFSPGMRLSQIDHAARRADLQRAIELEEFVLHYQPIVDLEADAVVGVEALVRWQHPSRGLVVPADFIPLAEETGQILPIGRWVLEESCAQVFAWQQMMPGRSLSLSVNLSGVQFRQRDLVDEVASALAGSGLDASSLVLEITESTLMADDSDTMSKLEELKALGVRCDR